MSSSESLTQQAVRVALEGKWQEAIEINLKILENEPNNIDSLNRLGRAYLQLSNFSKAKKIFKDVLDLDPVNQIAQKNYALAKDHIIIKIQDVPDAKRFVKEPGTTTECAFTLSSRNSSANDFYPGESLELKFTRKEIQLYKGERLLATTESDIADKLCEVKKQHGVLTVNFLAGKDKNIRVLIHSSIPAFKAERQEIRPYIKKGSLEEPELEVELSEEPEA